MRLFILLLAAIPAFPVNARDWFTGRRDPVTRFQCCGELDCHEVDDRDVRELIDGSYFYLPKSWTVPAARVQQSPDFRFYMCESPVFLDRRMERGVVDWRMICFFAPPRTM
jgi:hypothetical protein